MSSKIFPRVYFAEFPFVSKDMRLFGLLLIFLASSQTVFGQVYDYLLKECAEIDNRVPHYEGLGNVSKSDLRRLRHLADEHPNSQAAIWAQGILGKICWARGDKAEAIHRLTTCVLSSERFPPTDDWLWVLMPRPERASCLILAEYYNSRLCSDSAVKYYDLSFHTVPESMCLLGSERRIAVYQVAYANALLAAHSTNLALREWRRAVRQEARWYKPGYQATDIFWYDSQRLLARLRLQGNSDATLLDSAWRVVIKRSSLPFRSSTAGSPR